jgi:hypothetical protein
MSRNQWLVFIAFASFMFLGYHSRPVVAAFGVEMRTGRAEYLQGEEPILIIRNQGTNTVSFGSYYWLQRHQDVDWVTIPFRENVGFPDWLVILEPGEKCREKIRFGGLVEAPGEGRYRIAKELSIEEMDLTLIKYAEFYIRSNWSYRMVWDRFRMHVGITALALIVVITILMRKKTSTALIWGFLHKAGI